MVRSKIKTVVLLGLLIVAGGGEAFGQTRVLVLGGSQSYQTNQEAAFLTAGVATNLQAILAGDSSVSQPVTVQNTDTYQSDGGYFSSRTLMSWYYWPTNHAATLALLSSNWNYVVMVDDPHVASTFPEYHLEGVMRISQQVQASGAIPVSVMTWSSGTNALSKFGEMAYRVGDGLGVAVAPAGYAWNNLSAALKDAGTRPTARGAYVTAATIYSRLYNRSAKVSTYIPSGMTQADRDTLADVAFTTVQNEATNTHYSGTLRRPTHFAAPLVKKRRVTFAYWQSSTENRISDRLVTCFGVLRTAQSQPYTTSYQTWPDVLTPVDFGYSRFSSGYPSLVQNYSTFDYEDDSGATTMVTGMDRVMYRNPPVGWEQETGAADVTDSKMDLGEFFVPLRVLWARIHEAQPQIQLQDVLGVEGKPDLHHMIEPVNNGIAAMMTTLLTGRCPIGDEPAYDPNATNSYAWQDWFCRKMGYEVAMQHATLEPRTHGFVALPSSSSKIFLKPGISETMPVQFRYAPASNVTVNVTCNQSGAVVLSQTNLTFTPANYATVQNVVVDLAPGTLPVGPVTLSFDTQSADPAFDAVHDEWTYYAVPVITGFTNTLIAHTQPGTLVGTVTTPDDTYGILKFSIISGNSNGVFAINSGTGAITVAGDLNPATQSLYTLAVLATDNGTPASSATNYVQITVITNGSPSLPGTISYAVYDGIGSGITVGDLTNNARFPTDPDWEKQITSAEGDSNRADNYGSVLRGYLIPPVSGSYTFFIAADDSAELWMSTSTNPASMTLIANVPSWTDSRQWTKFGSQQSASRGLVAGQAYYLEARHKEGSGGDNLSVAWAGPATGGQTNVIPGLYLAPYFANYVPHLAGFASIVPRYTFAGFKIGQMTVTDANSSDLHSFTILSGNSAGIFGVDSNGWVYVADTNALAASVTTNFTLSIRTTDSGTPALSATNSATLNIVNQSNYTVRATIAVADSTAGVTSSTSTNISQAFTVSTGNVLVVNLSYRGTNSIYPAGPGPTNVYWVTGGSTVTQTMTQAVQAGNTAARAFGSSIYYLWNPNPGSGTISGSLPAGCQAQIISAFTLSGVDTNVSPIVASKIDNTTGSTSITSSTATNVPMGGFASLCAASVGTSGTGFSASPAGGTATNWWAINVGGGYWDQGYIPSLGGGAIAFSCAFGSAGRVHIVAAVFTPATIVPPVTYTLTANAGLGGTILPASATVSAGGSTNFVITASNYYRIASLTTNGTAVTGMTFDNNSTTTNFTWNNVQTSGVLAATFTNVLYTLTVNSGTGSGSYTNGQQVAITADAPAAGKAFDKWIGDTQYLAGATVTMPATNITLTATYADVYYALVINYGLGTGAALVTNGTMMSICADDPPSGYVFAHWSGDTAYLANSNAACTTLTMPATNVTVAADYTSIFPPVDPNLDSDGDGVKDWQEYIAGTNPTNATSCFKATQNTRNVITWSPATGRVYSVYWATNLINGFQPLETNILYPQSSYTNLNPGPRVNLYQIKVRMQ